MQKIDYTLSPTGRYNIEVCRRNVAGESKVDWFPPSVAPQRTSFNRAYAFCAGYVSAMEYWEHRIVPADEKD